MVRAVDVIHTAGEIVSGDRHRTHGDKNETMRGICDLWNAYLGSRLVVPIEAHEVATLNILQKIARSKSGSHNIDDWIDIAGYAGIGGEVAEGEE